MAEFSKAELLIIAGWAMDKADGAARRASGGTYAYETAKAIFEKAHRMCQEKEG